MTREAFALGLAGLIAVAAIVAVPYSVWLLRDAQAMARAVEELAAPNGRRVIARAHVRASRIRVGLAILVAGNTLLVVVIIAQAQRITDAVLAFLVLFAASRIVLAVDAALLARDRRAILHAAQRRRR